jgi:hypothetical protein
MIHHPQSPFQGQHYKRPVELIDIFPTALDLVGVPLNRDIMYNTGHKFGAYSQRFYRPLSGKSLAPIVLGSSTRSLSGIGDKRSKLRGLTAPNVSMPVLNMTFALSQVLRCAKIKDLQKQSDGYYSSPRRKGVWEDCDVNRQGVVDELALMGYSLRTSRFRYTAWVEMQRPKWAPNWKAARIPYDEELFDHRDETQTDMFRRETVNVASVPELATTLKRLRHLLLKYLHSNVIYSRAAPAF